MRTGQMVLAHTVLYINQHSVGHAGRIQFSRSIFLAPNLGRVDLRAESSSAPLRNGTSEHMIGR